MWSSNIYYFLVGCWNGARWHRITISPPAQPPQGAVQSGRNSPKNSIQEQLEALAPPLLAQYKSLFWKLQTLESKLLSYDSEIYVIFEGGFLRKGKKPQVL
jgi:hypothetical protein